MLSLLTFNINGYATGHGPWQARRELVAEALAQADADVVLLQAVQCRGDVEGGRDQADQLGQRLGYVHHAFHPVAERPGGEREGPAILSRLPLENVRPLELSLEAGLDDDTRRAVLRATVRAPGGAVEVCSAHFSWVPEQAADNVRETLDAVPLGRRTVIGGDLNATPDSEAVTTIARAGWVDAWATLRGGEPGASFESDTPSIRIDYLWLTPDLARGLTDVRLLAFETDERGHHASDHLALACRLDDRSA